MEWKVPFEGADAVGLPAPVVVAAPGPELLEIAGNEFSSAVNIYNQRHVEGRGGEGSGGAANTLRKFKYVLS